MIVMTKFPQTAASDAEQLAAFYGYDIGRLKYEWDRRSFGSCTLTLDGSHEQRDRYRQAWQFAVARAAKAEAA